MKPKQMSAVIGAKRYDTGMARLLAAGPRVDTPEEQFGNTFLFRMPGGEYFETHETFFDSRRDKLAPLTRNQAIELWAKLPKRTASFETAFRYPCRGFARGGRCLSVETVRIV